MGKIIADITMSLDGFIAGPGITQDDPMGRHGRRLHDWMFASKTGEALAMLNELIQSSGAVITGNHTYTTAIHGVWESVTPFSVPAFVVCHQAPQEAVEGFEYVTGIEASLEKAVAAAGEKDIWVMGGASIIQQFIKAGLADELHIHIAPLLLKDGRRLFENNSFELEELQLISVMETSGALHVKYKLKG